jgi:hypothetical protein
MILQLSYRVTMGKELSIKQRLSENHLHRLHLCEITYGDIKEMAGEILQPVAITWDVEGMKFLIPSEVLLQLWDDGQVWEKQRELKEGIPEPRISISQCVRLDKPNDDSSNR